MTPVRRLFMKAALRGLSKRAADPFTAAEDGTDTQQSDAGDQVGQDTDANMQSNPLSWKAPGGSYQMSGTIESAGRSQRATAGQPASSSSAMAAPPAKIAMLLRRGR